MFHGRRIKMFVVALMVWSTSALASDPMAVPGEFVVKLKDGVKIQQVFQQLGQVKELISKQSKAYLIKRPLVEKASFALQSLNSNPMVEYAEPNYIYSIEKLPNDPDLGKLWGLLNEGQSDGKNKGLPKVDIDAVRAWDIQTGSRKVVVAVIDTGVDYTLPDLKHNIWVNKAELNGKKGVDDDGNGFIDDIHGYDFANNDGDPKDDHGHGSHVSGTIGAEGDDGKGIVGVNWKVRIMGVKFLSASGSGTLANAVKAIDYATQMGVDIMSNSWGGGGYSKALEEAIQRANDAGILFVAAAGNSSSNNDKDPHYPSNYEVDNVLAVAAIDNRGMLAGFSSYGRTTVDVAAPGVRVYSTTPKGYKSWSGTSMATPHVSGVAALLMANEKFNSPKEIIDRIIFSSRPLAGLRNKVLSGGIVNAYYALTNQQAPADPNDPYQWDKEKKVVSTPHPYESNKTYTFTVTREGAKKIAVYFEKFDVEAGYDEVTFKDRSGKVIGVMTGNQDESFSPVAEGDTIVIELKTDNIINKYGFDISQVAFVTK
ncbi:MAG: subtilase [Bdellovibrio sp.]|nr:MAG: subtilase [Bdellovibrio sp.]